jgi:hypothetical protein
VVVAPAGEGEYRLVDGERRVRAAAKLGLVEIPAVVRDTDERTLGLEDAVVGIAPRRGPPMVACGCLSRRRRLSKPRRRGR